MSKSVTCSFCCESSKHCTHEFVAALETDAVICVRCINVCIDTINEHRTKEIEKAGESA